MPDFSHTGILQLEERKGKGGENFFITYILDWQQARKMARGLIVSHDHVAIYAPTHPLFRSLSPSYLELYDLGFVSSGEMTPPEVLQKEERSAS